MRAGAGVDRLHAIARECASARQRAQIDEGQLSWAAFYRLAAKGIFGADYAKPVRYAALQTRMRALGLEAELDALLTELPRPLLTRLRAEGAPPLELFTARAESVSAWAKSPHPMASADLRAELLRDGRTAELDRLPAAEKARAEGGEMPAVEIARLLEARRHEDVDVLVIGAGAAGIGAANALLDAGRSVTVLEAKSRDGGRAHTDYAFGVPFDHGCAWIHESAKNPFLPLVQALGFETYSTEKFQKVFVGGDPVEDAALLKERMEEVSKRWQIGARKRPDARASLLSAPQHRLDDLAAEVLGPLEIALELDQFSVGEFQSIVEEKDDRLVEGGLGNIVHAFSYGLPIELESPITKVSWSKDGVEVESNGRTFRAKKIVLTMSPKALRERVVFDPPLPAWKVDAIEQLQMASFEKIGLRFAPGALNEVKPFERACGFDDEGRPFELLMKPFGQDVAVVMTGGEVAQELLDKPEKEAFAYALSVVTQHYGAPLSEAFLGGERTGWTVDPDVGGTWAVEKVGSRDDDRKDYAAAIDDTVFTAGEACGGAWAATVNGAFFNGRDIAEQVVAALLAKKAAGAPK